MPNEAEMRVAIEKLVARYAPSKNKEQLAGLVVRCSEHVAICFDSSPARVTQLMMSHLYVDPNQASLL